MATVSNLMTMSYKECIEAMDQRVNMERSWRNAKTTADTPKNKAAEIKDFFEKNLVTIDCERAVYTIEKTNIAISLRTRVEQFHHWLVNPDPQGLDIKGMSKVFSVAAWIMTFLTLGIFYFAMLIKCAIEDCADPVENSFDHESAAYDLLFRAKPLDPIMAQFRR